MSLFRSRPAKIHFVGVGGIGMSGIAEVLLNLGYQVSGSDLKESDTTRRLASLGGRMWRGHAREHVEQVDVVVTSSAVRRDDPEHLDHWKTPEALRQGFVAFVNRVPFYGLAILCIDHPGVQALIPDVEKRFVTYREAPQADYRAAHIDVSGGKVSFDAFRREEPLGRFTLAMVGRHNALNALAVVALGDEMCLPTEVTREALASFAGVQRRFTVRGEAGGVT